MESPQIWNFRGHRANTSFPSNQPMNGCVVAMELLRHNTKGSKLMAVLAGILAFSRVFAGMHYPSDVLGGAAIAAIVHKAVHMPAVSALTGALAAFGSWLSDDLVRKVTGR